MKDALAIQNSLQTLSPPTQRTTTHPPSVLLVLGMHRSGTSALTRVLNLLGADLPQHLVPAKQGNELGFWESADLNETHNQLFRELGRDWQSIDPMPANWFMVPPAGAYRDRIVKLLSRDFPNGDLFAIKDPRICRLVPLWREVLKVFGAEPRVVLPLRNPLEVAASLKALNGMAQGKALLLWLLHVLDAERYTRDLPRSFVDYDDLLRDWRSETRRMFRELELEWPNNAVIARKVDQFLSDKARHHRIDGEQFGATSDVAVWVKEAYYALRAMVGQPYDTGSMQRLDEIADKLSEAGQLYRPVFASQRALLDERQADLEQQRSEVETRRSELDSLHGELHGLRSELSRFEAELDKSQTELEQRSQTIAHLEDQLNQRDQRIGELSHFQTRQEALLEERKQRLNELNTRIDQRERTLQEQGHALARSQELRLQEREQQVLDLTDRLAEIRQQAQTTRRLLDQARDREERLHKEVTYLRSEADTHTRVLQHELQQSRRHRGHLLQTLRLLQASRIWRWTSPVRHIGQWAGLARAEGLSRLRRIRAEHALLRHSPLFDRAFYLQQYPDVAGAGHEPLLHFLCFGVHEGRKPNPLFDTRWYLKTYPDVAADTLNPLIHYLLHGATEGRDPNPLFDSDWYLKQYPDVVKNGHNPLAHYLLHGAGELRDPGPEFSTRRYLHEHPDVLLIGINPLAHYWLTQPGPGHKNGTRAQ